MTASEHTAADRSPTRVVEIRDQSLGIVATMEISDGAIDELYLHATNPVGAARLATVLPHLGLMVLPITPFGYLPADRQPPVGDDDEPVDEPVDSIGPTSPTFTPAQPADDEPVGNGARPPRRPRRPPPPDDELVAVIQAHGGAATTDQIATHYDVARATAGRWVQQARARGAL